MHAYERWCVGFLCLCACGGDSPSPLPGTAFVSSEEPVAENPQARSTGDLTTGDAGEVGASDGDGGTGTAGDASSGSPSVVGDGGSGGRADNVTVVQGTSTSTMGPSSSSAASSATTGGTAPVDLTQPSGATVVQSTGTNNGTPGSGPGVNAGTGTGVGAGSSAFTPGGTNAATGLQVPDAGFPGTTTGPVDGQGTGFGSRGSAGPSFGADPGPGFGFPATETSRALANAACSAPTGTFSRVVRAQSGACASFAYLVEPTEIIASPRMTTSPFSIGFDNCLVNASELDTQSCTLRQSVACSSGTTQQTTCLIDPNGTLACTTVSTTNAGVCTVDALFVPSRS